MRVSQDWQKCKKSLFFFFLTFIITSKFYLVNMIDGFLRQWLGGDRISGQTWIHTSVVTMDGLISVNLSFFIYKMGVLIFTS